MQHTLTELMSSRICHDLISPVGAIGNGLDLISEVSGHTPELELIGQSAHTAQAKLKFFRVAFGAGGACQIGGPEAQRVASEMFSMGRLSISFSSGWGDRERGLVKLFYLLLLCTESSLPRGGEIICAPTNSGWEIRVSGSSVNPQEALWNHVLNGAELEALTAKNIHFTLARNCLIEKSMTLSAEIRDDSFVLSF